MKTQMKLNFQHRTLIMDEYQQTSGIQIVGRARMDEISDIVRHNTFSALRESFL